jgi:hypothetical protein
MAMFLYVYDTWSNGVPLYLIRIAQWSEFQIDFENLRWEIITVEAGRAHFRISEK